VTGHGGRSEFPHYAIKNGSAGHQQVMAITVPEAPRWARAWVAAGSVCLLCAALSGFALYSAAQAQADARENRAALDRARESMARKYDRMEDYQRTMFMLVPDLKKMVDAEMAKREEKR
jgi:hypothetical protein